MTDQQTLPERVRALSEVATPGPWEVYDDTRPGIDAVDGPNIIYCARFAGRDFGGVGRKVDAEFIVEAVNYVRSLSSSQEPSLDAERLARALVNANGWNPLMAGGVAQKIAAEYARLSQSEGQEPA